MKQDIINLTNNIYRQVKEANNVSCELEIINRLFDDYQRFRRLRKIAEKEGAVETVKAIDEEISFIKLKLQPLKLPED